MDFIDLLGISRRTLPTATSIAVAAALVFFPQVVTQMLLKEAESKAAQLQSVCSQALSSAIHSAEVPKPGSGEGVGSSQRYRRSPALDRW